MHENLRVFKEVRSISGAVAVHVFLAQDVFPQLSWETGSRIPGQPPHKPLCLGVSCSRDMNRSGRLSHWRHRKTCRFREGWKPLLSVVHRPLGQQKSSESEKLRH